MAQKATVYKAEIQLSDIDRQIFETLSLTLALHPSETLERMATRLLVYCLNTSERLQFTRGISSTDEPDLWEKNLHDGIVHWIEVGQPEPERIKKALKLADRVSVYAFGKSANTWWQKNTSQFEALKAHQVWQFDWHDIQAVSALLDRNTSASVTITEGIMYLSIGDADTSIQPVLLHSA